MATKNTESHQKTRSRRGCDPQDVAHLGSLVHWLRYSAAMNPFVFLWQSPRIANYLMKELSRAFAAALLKHLRPIDISLGIKVLSGSPLKPRPSLHELIEPKARLFWLAALTSYAQGQSHSGLYLDASSSLADVLDSSDQDLTDADISLLDLLGSGDALCQEFPTVVVTAENLESKPEASFVYRSDSQLIYLQRWYRMEAMLGAFVRDRLRRPPRALPESFFEVFQDFIAPEGLAENPWQAAACFAALRHDFSIITGGPGTGKTTTVTRLIGLLMSLPVGMRPESIQMVAPTGKAAERMRESFNGNLNAMLAALPEHRRQPIVEQKDRVLHPASTIHSFLGSQGNRGFRQHAGNPVSCDVLIVDESSMIDLELFIALLDALPQECHLILLGDKNQLAAVGTGNVFTDLTGTCDAIYGNLNVNSMAFSTAFEALSTCTLPSFEDAEALCGDHVVELTKSYRFTGKSEVGQLARILLDEGRLPHAGELEVPLTDLGADWRGRLKQSLAAYKTVLLEGTDASVLLEVIGQVRVLCAVRGGEYGVEAINDLLGEFVLGRGVAMEQPQNGLPFIIRSNDKNLGLANGDCGVFRVNEGGDLLAYLPAAELGGEPRSYTPYALPNWDPAFALTIHKSQGSEYDSVVVVLPEMKRQFLSWELVYTAITRGKRHVSLILPDALIGQHLPRVQRRSGLREELLVDYK